MKVGFTGTQKGMTLKQRTNAQEYIRGGIEFHHGDCKGADEQANFIASCRGLRIVIHPPNKSAKRAFCVTNSKGEVRPTKGYIERNHDIVDETDMLVATPSTMKEEVRSGTWATIRYARKQNKKIIILFPSGTIQIENEEIPIPPSKYYGAQTQYNKPRRGTTKHS